MCTLALSASAHAAQRPAEDDITALRGARTVRIVVEESYADGEIGPTLTGITLPSRDVARVLFEAAGVMVVTGADADAVWERRRRPQ